MLLGRAALEGTFRRWLRPGAPHCGRHGTRPDPRLRAMTGNLRRFCALFHADHARTRRRAPVRAAHRLTDSGSDSGSGSGF
ncbi:hypothetical protein Shyhy02_24920 [Streptomyces hygroscopicus subsp. hygroscopicus]|nr:hypothetical protein Shyhy02_24920 [Streptomyces hygroscopicus subsp. hygroscopicus]